MAGGSRTDALERLEALGYLPYVVENTAPRKTGVVRHDPARSNPGFNLYNSYYQTGAYLLDNSGTPLHSWAPADTRPHWQYVTLYDDDSLLVSIEQKMLQRVAWDSRIIWQARIRTHHDVTVDGNGDIYTLASEDEMVFFRGFPVPIVNDHITVLSPDGTVTKQVSLFAALEERIPSNRIWKAYRRIIRPKNVWKTLKRRVKGWRQVLGHRFEVLHTNSLVILDTDVEGLGRKGDALISVKHLDLVGIVDLETGRLTWSWGPGKVDRQHHATVVDGGNILVFDNGTRRGYSRVVEIDPLTRRVTWEYRADPPSAFYSSWGGAAQRLPNGNTLITDTASGRAFEVTRDGEIVWEFFNPQRHKRRRATIYRLQRIVNAGGRARLRELEERI
jgi:hypothetical protein